MQPQWVLQTRGLDWCWPGQVAGWRGGMGSKVIRTSEVGSNPNFATSYFYEEVSLSGFPFPYLSERKKQDS